MDSIGDSRLGLAAHEHCAGLMWGVAETLSEELGEDVVAVDEYGREFDKLTFRRPVHPG